MMVVQSLKCWPGWDWAQEQTPPVLGHVKKPVHAWEAKGRTSHSPKIFAGGTKVGVPRRTGYLFLNVKVLQLHGE